MIIQRYELDYPFSHGGLLDLNEVELYGWEPQKDAEKVEKMLAAIARRETFPPVPVVEEAGEYYLTPTIEDSFGLSDGGHHRAVAHHIACEPLPVAVLSSSGVSYTFHLQIAIRDIELI